MNRTAAICGVLVTILACFPAPVLSVPKNLSLPIPELCASRKVHTTLGESEYYISWLEPDTRSLFLNWLDARNWCRDRCMDLVSLELPEEIKMVKKAMSSYNVKYCWTSGRLCDFGDCFTRKDLQPLNINGWFWSGSGQRMRRTDEQSSYNDWSPTGGLKKPQPDNREKLQGSYSESCLAYLNNYYNDGIKWHDVACHHIKSFVCESNPILLNLYSRAATF